MLTMTVCPLSETLFSVKKELCLYVTPPLPRPPLPPFRLILQLGLKRKKWLATPLGMKGKWRRKWFSKVPSTVSSLFPAKALIRSETKTTTVSSVIGWWTVSSLKFTLNDIVVYRSFKGEGVSHNSRLKCCFIAPRYVECSIRLPRLFPASTDVLSLVLGGGRKRVHFPPAWPIQGSLRASSPTWASERRSCVLARLASLAKIGELGRRQKTSEKRPLLPGNVDKSGRSITITRCFVGLTTIDR